MNPNPSPPPRPRRSRTLIRRPPKTQTLIRTRRRLASLRGLRSPILARSMPTSPSPAPCRSRYVICLCEGLDFDFLGFGWEFGLNRFVWIWMGIVGGFVVSWFGIGCWFCCWLFLFCLLEICVCCWLFGCRENAGKMKETWNLESLV